MTSSGEAGWIATWHSHDEHDRPIEEPVKTLHLTETNIFVSNSSPAGITERWTMKLKGKLRALEKDAPWQFGLIVAGKARFYLDGELVIDNWTWQRRGEGESYFVLRRTVSGLTCGTISILHDRN